MNKQNSTVCLSVCGGFRDQKIRFIPWKYYVRHNALNFQRLLYENNEITVNKLCFCSVRDENFRPKIEEILLRTLLINSLTKIFFVCEYNLNVGFSVRQ